MSNCVKKATTTILLKLASADGEINIDELSLLEMFADDQPADELFSNAVEMEIPELVANIEKPEDRFVIRLKAQAMVNADGDVNSSERALINKLVEELPLSAELWALLKRAVELEKQTEGGALNEPGVQEIYQKSSFAE